jgi:hypothetical protein
MLAASLHFVNITLHFPKLLGETGWKVESADGTAGDCCINKRSFASPSPGIAVFCGAGHAPQLLSASARQLTRVDNRYYVSQAVLQNQPQAAGSIGRVPAAEIEALIGGVLRNHLQAAGAGQADNDRDLVERYLQRATLMPDHIKLRLRQIAEAPEEIGSHDDPKRDPSGHPIPRVTTIAIPWTSPVPVVAKGIIHVFSPSSRPPQAGITAGLAARASPCRS